MSEAHANAQRIAREWLALPPGAMPRYWSELDDDGPAAIRAAVEDIARGEPPTSCLGQSITLAGDGWGRYRLAWSWSCLNGYTRASLVATEAREPCGGLGSRELPPEPATEAPE